MYSSVLRVVLGRIYPQNVNKAMYSSALGVCYIYFVLSKVYLTIFIYSCIWIKFPIEIHSLI